MPFNLFKTSQREADKLRPVGVKNPLVRTFNRQAARQNRPVLQRHLEPQQLALSPAGGHKLVHMVRMCLEKNPDWVCVKLDVQNAHNSISRAAVVAALEAEPGALPQTHCLAFCHHLCNAYWTGDRWQAVGGGW